MMARLTPESCLLLVVDVQTRLLPEMWQAQRVERNCAILACAARLLDVPVVVTEQNPNRIGPTVSAIQGALGDFSRVEKMSFSAYPAVKKLIENSERKTILLCGLEAHICVLQTGLDLIAEGYTIFVVADAISSRQEHNYHVGWERLQMASAVPTSSESAVFELLNTAESPHFKAILNLIK